MAAKICGDIFNAYTALNVRNRILRNSSTILFLNYAVKTPPCTIGTSMQEFSNCIYMFLTTTIGDIG